MMRVMIAGLALMVMSHPLLAETISGRTLDEDEPVPMAEVMLMDANSNVLIKRVQTDSGGGYRIEVDPGVYKLRAYKEAYIYTWVKDVAVDGKDVVVDIAMTPEAFAENSSAPASDDCD